MKRYLLYVEQEEEDKLGDWVKYEDAQAAIQEAVREALSDAARRVEAAPAGMFNCDMTGSPVDEYIAKWKAIQALENP